LGCRQEHHLEDSNARPIVVGDRIYMTCYSGFAVPGAPGGNIDALQRHLLCLQRTDGKVVWQKDVAAVQPESPKVRDHGYASSTPVSDGKNIYVFFGKSGVIAFDLQGKQLWHADVGSKVHGWGSASSPVLYKDLVIVNAAVESESLIALNKTTGKEAWRLGGMKESWNTPILVPLPNGKTELVVAIMGKILGVNPDTGEQLWSCATDIGWYMVPSLVNDKDVVYCIGGRGTGGALAVRAGGKGDVTATQRLWKSNKGSNVPSPIVHEGHVYWVHEGKGTVSCVKAEKGEVVFEESIAPNNQFYGSPVLANGKIYFLSRRGEVFVVAAKPKYELLATNSLVDRSTFDASPAVDGNRLLIRSDKFLYCIGEK
jgi:outer membrane protein assembly factor BamB